jgi:hypothetical protein
MSLTGSVHAENTFASTRSLTTARKLHTATLLADGKALITSKTDGTNKA